VKDFTILYIGLHEGMAVYYVTI